MVKKRAELVFDGFGVNGPDAYRTRVASVHGPDMEANARLIAAAPELLAACRLVFEHNGNPAAYSKQLMAAIAKAEGGK